MNSLFPRKKSKKSKARLERERWIASDLRGYKSDTPDILKSLPLEPPGHPSQAWKERA